MLITDALQRIPQYTRSHRHLWSVIRHGTIKKLVNLAAVEIERKLRRIHVLSRPYILIIDPCNYCNLRCPLCPTGLNDLGRVQSMMSLEQFQQYIEPHLPYLFEAYMHNWGESLINKEVFKMIAYAQSRNVGTNLSSNFVLVTDSDIDNLIDCGLEYLVISLDGVSQETYGKYRVRGNYERVIENLQKIVEKKRLLKRKTPFIEWQFIVMRHNEHEVPAAKALAKELGVDIIRFIPVGMPYDTKNRMEVMKKWYPDSRMKDASDFSAETEVMPRQQKPGPCFYLYRSTVINPEGGVSPCCEVYQAEHDFTTAEVMAEDFGSAWNSDKYTSARKEFTNNRDGGNVKTVCSGCDIFTKLR